MDFFEILFDEEMDTEVAEYIVVKSFFEKHLTQNKFILKKNYFEVSEFSSYKNSINYAVYFSDKKKTITKISYYPPFKTPYYKEIISPDIAVELLLQRINFL